MTKRMKTTKMIEILALLWYRIYINIYSTIPTEGTLAPATRLNKVEKTERLHEVKIV